jgi:hypothetical protein
MGDISLANSDTHPTPDREGLKITYSDYCGCTSIEVLQHWIKRNNIRSLKRKKYIVKTYKINARYVKLGRTQVLFERLKAEVIDTKCVSALYE